MADDKVKSPATYALYQNFPNPFNPTTVIAFNLTDNGYVSLKIYDMLGREIKTLVNEFRQAGYHEVEFSTGQFYNGIIESSSGIYFYTLRTKNYSETKKMILLK